MRQLLQQLWASQRIHTSVFLIPHLHVVELVGVVGTQQLDRLLQLDEIVLQGDVVEAADVIGEEFNVGRELLDAVRVDAANGGGEGERQDGLGGVADGIKEHEFLDFGGQGEEDGGHDVAEVLGEGLDVVDGSVGGRGGLKLYSAVSTRSSILELTSSKMRFSAVFLWSRNAAVAARETVEVVEWWGEERAATRRVSSSVQAVSKWEMLMRICTIWPRYWDESLETREEQTLVVRRSSSAILRRSSTTSGCWKSEATKK